VRYKFEDIAINSIAKKKPTNSDKNTYLGLEHLDSGNLTVTRFGSDVAPIGEKLIMKKGDVLFGKRRAYQKKVAIAPFDGIFSAHGMVLRPKEQVVCKDFFPLFISSDYFLDAAIKISVGSLSPTINWSALKELEFELPSITQQQQLSKILWAATETKNSYKMLLLLTEKLVMSRFVEMFGNVLSNDRKWATEQLDKVAPTKAFQGDIESEDEKYWLLNLDMIEAQTGKIISKNMVHVEEISNSTIAFSTDNVLFSKLRPYLNKVVIPDQSGYATTELLPLLPDKCVLNTLFFVELLRGNEFLKYIQEKVAGTKMPRVQMDVLKNFPIILPPLSLQNRFAEFVKQADKSKFADLRQTKVTTLLYNSINGG
jgi:type I restriction enzyme, S subunit